MVISGKMFITRLMKNKKDIIVTGFNRCKKPCWQNLVYYTIGFISGSYFTGNFIAIDCS